jgi:hypothetical protein
MVRITPGLVVAAAAQLLSLMPSDATAQPTLPEILLGICVADPDRCAMSVLHVTGGWEAHQNADRPQVTASTFKILVLFAYADAVSRGKVDPNRVVTLDEWASLWAGFDGGALAAAYNRLGRPVGVTVDELASTMMRESDNAAADFLLDLVGPRVSARVIKRWVPGFHDPLRPTGVLFATNDNNPDEPDIGLRVVEDYRGFENAGYQRELDAILAAMRDPDYVRQIRTARCEFPPWESPPPGCVPERHNTNAIWTALNNHFFMRSTTRTYAALMRGVLEGDLLPRRMRQIVERHLEWWLETPEILDRFSRYGGKGGSLTPGGVLNWTSYLDCRESGDRVAVSIQLRRGLRVATGQNRLFAEEVACNPEFAEQVRAAFPPEPERPELSLRLIHVKSVAYGNGRKLGVLVDVLNTSPFATRSGSEVRLFASSDNVLDAEDVLLTSATTTSLPSYGAQRLRLKSSDATAPDATFLIAIADAGNEIEEADEENNIVWERIAP